MSDSNVSQEKSNIIKARVDKKIARDFQIALTINGESMQDVLTRAALEYIQKTVLPNDTLLGKSK